MEPSVSDLNNLLNVNNSLCWVIILFNVLAIFYLVFCSFYRITKIVRITGWVWVGFLFTTNLGVMLYKPDLYSLLCLIFTVMIMMAIISVVLPPIDNQRQDEYKEEPNLKREGKVGSFVIRELEDENFSFELYDVKNQFLANSYYCYASIEETKFGIGVARENGNIASIEDRTLHWIKEMNHPKFVIYSENGKYYFKLNVDKVYTILESVSFDNYEECKKIMYKAAKAVKSKDVYISVDVIPREASKKYKDRLYGANNGKAEEPVKGTERVEVPKAVEKVEPVKVEEAAVTVAPIIEQAEEVKQPVLKIPVRKTLVESYELLTATQKKFFDGIKKHASSKSGIRVIESKYEMLFKYNYKRVMVLRISSNVVVAGLPLMDNTVKAQLATSNTKLKETLTVIKVNSKDLYDTAIKTFDVKYDLVVSSSRKRKGENESETDDKSNNDNDTATKKGAK